jgi:hypothetical protein
MNQRIQNLYTWQCVLLEAKINFVSEELAEQGFRIFTRPTKGNSEEEKKHKDGYPFNDQRNPTESKFCVSYGQLKDAIDQLHLSGTTKEGDKITLCVSSFSYYRSCRSLKIC